MIRALLAVFALPATATHEAIHCLFAAPWARRVALVFDVQRGHPAAMIDWRNDETAPKAIAALAPFVVGILLGIGVLRWWLMTGTPLPRGASTAAAWLVIGVWWVILTTPSGDDLAFVNVSPANHSQPVVHPP